MKFTLLQLKDGDKSSVELSVSAWIILPNKQERGGRRKNKQEREEKGARWRNSSRRPTEQVTGEGGKGARNGKREIGGEQWGARRKKKEQAREGGKGVRRRKARRRPTEQVAGEEGMPNYLSACN
jgi:hypothetical protein